MRRGREGLRDAVEEVGHCLDTLKFSGVSLFASYDGKFLGDAKSSGVDGLIIANTTLTVPT